MNIKPNIKCCFISAIRLLHKYFRNFPMGKKAYLTRKLHFSAGHRLHSTLLTTEENKRIYGKCNNLNGHGHNYNVEVTLYGEIDEKTGMVYNIDDLKKEVEAAIMDVVDHKNLDLDVEYFKSIPSTSENIAIYLYDNMKKHMLKPELLHEIKLYETENNIVIYKGD